MSTYDVVWNAVYTNSMSSLNSPAPGIDPVGYEECDKEASAIADEEATKYSDTAPDTIVYDMLGYPIV